MEIKRSTGLGPGTGLSGNSRFSEIIMRALPEPRIRSSAALCEMIEFHADLAKEKALEAIIELSALEDIECQEYAAFSLAHLASNTDFQVELVQLGAVRPLVAMLASDTEPRHYAGLALLKLADNFQNHLKIAEEGGIQALLRLGRVRSTDEQLQYKAALTVGQLASNAVRLIPTGASSGERPDGSNASAIGHGANMMRRVKPKGQNAAGAHGKDSTSGYLEKSLQDNPTLKSGNAGGMNNTMTQTALNIGIDKKTQEL